jgi:CRISPR/Cas system-associated exonuclease Cas4 (RecB family)
MKSRNGIEFRAEDHSYWHKGRRLSGITGRIAEHLGIKMPDEFVSTYRDEGVYVHQSIEDWINGKEVDTAHPGLLWVFGTFDRAGAISEFLVSDYKKYASSIDIVRGGALFDIKAGNFKREYCTLQLSVYKYFMEEYEHVPVESLSVISLKDREYYPIIPAKREKIEKILYG